MVAPRITAALLIAAIEGSHGIKSVIYGKVPCSAQTLDRWLTKSPTVLAAYETECSKMLGIAHSVVTGNILAASVKQEANKADPKKKGLQVDSGDARWYLTKKGKHEGFGAEDTVQTVKIGITLGDWRKRSRDRRQQVEDL